MDVQCRLLAKRFPKPFLLPLLLVRLREKSQRDHPTHVTATPLKHRGEKPQESFVSPLYPDNFHPWHSALPWITSKSEPREALFLYHTMLPYMDACAAAAASRVEAFLVCEVTPTEHACNVCLEHTRSLSTTDLAARPSSSSWAVASFSLSPQGFSKYVGEKSRTNTLALKLACTHTHCGPTRSLFFFPPPLEENANAATTSARRGSGNVALFVGD